MAARLAYADRMASPRETSNARAAKPQSSAPDDRLRAPPPYAGSALADAVHRAADHFGGRDADPSAPPDPIEMWGRRIGRTLSLIACIGLGIYLYMTYVR